MSYLFHYVICIKWCCYLRHFIVSSASFHRVICVISRCEISLMTRQFLANCTMMCILACHELMITYGEKHITNGFISIVQILTSCLLRLQRCKRCTFYSPGLTSESEVYPGLFAVSGNNAVGVVPFIYRCFMAALHIENVQHLRR